jgi:hypothetical protein
LFGWGAGIFFLGYFLFEVPSNIVLKKTVARIWIARITIIASFAVQPTRRTSAASDLAVRAG